MTVALETADPLGTAVTHLRAGGLVPYPTETVWGLGADARSERAVGRIRAWKGTDRPLALLVTGLSALEPLGFEVEAWVRDLLECFWPGPLTVVLPCPMRFARGIAGPRGGVGVRCSAHPVAAALASRLVAEGIGPLTATSLNRHGEPPARTRQEAQALSGEGGDAPRWLDLPGPDGGSQPPSTVLDCTASVPRVLRPGALDLAELAPWLAPEGRP